MLRPDMDHVLEILDRLEGVVRRHLARLPAAHRPAAEREVLGLLHMARSALPRDLQQASRLLAEAERTLADAREEARRLVLDAQARAGAGGAAPPAGAQALLDEARREAERVRRGADDYAASVLQRLEAEVDRVLATIRRGQEVLRSQGPAGRE